MTDTVLSCFTVDQLVDYPANLFKQQIGDNVEYINLTEASHRHKKFFISIGSKLKKNIHYRLLMRIKFKTNASALRLYLREKAQIKNATLLQKIPNKNDNAWTTIDLTFTPSIENADCIFFAAEDIHGKGSFISFDYIVISAIQPNKRETTFPKLIPPSTPTFNVPQNPSTINDLNDTLCTGCGVCANICPTKCIAMEENAEGFLFPKIGKGCINCGKCNNVCPVLKKSKLNAPIQQYAIMADDNTRFNASSGGVFPTAARQILNEGGLVVGAGWNTDFTEVHLKLIDNVDALPDLCYSKYVQSYSFDIFEQVQSKLKKGQKILFTGCPCQIAGLNNYLNKDYSNLITMEIICHGVPSPLAWKKWLDINVPKDASIKSVCMRNKELGWKGKLLMHLQLPNDTITQVRETRDGVFNRAFLKNYSLRKSCYNCYFKSQEVLRPADITIGDFWGVEKIDPSLTDDKGTSLVLVNNDKGLLFFNSLRFNLKKDVSLKQASQSNLRKSVDLPSVERKILMKSLNRYLYNDAVALAERKKGEVGILGNYVNENIGGQLTTYAAYKAVEDLGYSAKICRYDNHFTKNQFRKHIWETLCKFTKANNKQLQALNDELDSFVTCSDWTFYKTWSKGWNFFLQPFTSDEKIRISFAASFGNGGGYKEEDLPEVKRRLSRFTALGIREPSGIAFCKEIGVDNAVFMHDPVFSLDKEFYKSLSEVDKERRQELQATIKQKYAAIYLRTFSTENLKRAAELAQKRNLIPLLIMGYKSELEKAKELNADKFGIKTFDRIVTMCEWLWFFDHSEMIITDSFHATCFSLILNVPFITFKRFENPKFSKLSTLLGNADLLDRLVDSKAPMEQMLEITAKPVNFDELNAKLAEWRNQSITFIDKALQDKAVTNPKAD